MTPGENDPLPIGVPMPGKSSVRSEQPAQSFATPTREKDTPTHVKPREGKRNGSSVDRKSRPPQRPKKKRKPRKPPNVELLRKVLIGALFVVLAVIAGVALDGVMMIGSLIVLFVGAISAIQPGALDTILPAKHHPTGPVPKRGVRGIFWKLIGSWLYSRFGWTRLTNLSLREREYNALEELWSMRKTQKIVAFVNSKGGSAKTAVAVWLSVFLAHAVKRHIVSLDANENTGHTAKRLGIFRQSEAEAAGSTDWTIELRTFIKACKIGGLDSFEHLSEVVDWHRETGVSVIASEEASNEPFSQEDFQHALLTAKQSAHCIFCDTGNGIKYPANLGSVHEAQTVVFAGNVSMADSLPDIKNTRTRYADLGYADKVQKGLIVIVGAPPKDRKKYAEDYNHPLERVFVIPFNRYMKLGKVAKTDKVPLKIRVVCYEILVAIMAAEPGINSPESEAQHKIGATLSPEW